MHKQAFGSFEVEESQSTSNSDKSVNITKTSFRPLNSSSVVSAAVIEYRSQQHQQNDADSEIHELQQLPHVLGDDRLYQIVYSNLLYYPVMYVMPLVTLAYLNVRLVKSLNDVKRRRRASTAAAASVAAAAAAASSTAAAGYYQSFAGSTATTISKLARRAIGRAGSHNRRRSRRDDNITQCVVGIVTVFIVCQTPALFNQVKLMLT